MRLSAVEWNNQPTFFENRFWSECIKTNNFFPRQRCFLHFVEENSCIPDCSEVLFDPGAFIFIGRSRWTWHSRKNRKARHAGTQRSQGTNAFQGCIFSCKATTLNILSCFLSQGASGSTGSKGEPVSFICKNGSILFNNKNIANCFF